MYGTVLWTEYDKHTFGDRNVLLGRRGLKSNNSLSSVSRGHLVFSLLQNPQRKLPFVYFCVFFVSSTNSYEERRCRDIRLMHVHVRHTRVTGFGINGIGGDLLYC